MILTAILIIILLIKLSVLKNKSRKLLLFQVIFFLLCISLQLLFLSIFKGTFFVGSDSIFFSSKGKELNNIVNMHGLFSNDSFYFLKESGTSYVIYIIFNFLSYSPNEFIFSLLTKLNNVLATLIFFSNLLYLFQKQNIKLNGKRKYFFIFINLFFAWLVILNFRDNLIAIFICSIFLNVADSQKNYFKIAINLIFLYFLRPEITYVILLTLFVFKFLNKYIGNKIIFISHIIIFMIWYFIPLPDFLKILLWSPEGDSGIHNSMTYEQAMNLDNSLAGKMFTIRYLQGMFYGFLANSPLSIIIDYFRYPTGMTWYYTPLTNLLNLFVHFINTLFVYPLILTFLIGDKEQEGKYDRLFYMGVFFVLLIYGFYSVKWGVQDRIRIPLHILLITLFMFKPKITKRNFKIFKYIMVFYSIWIIVKALIVYLLGY
ncbi:hypothetical protein IEC97_11375 [Neobacillus cucumis]|uniref:hypothetical protein n=1 Tax=Neobacillus cucumis TaxID=1740721 RepID=UPI0018DFAB09|nr:hypothetical protein [Neobacillus cucumis]MBI0577959.1 hypothetical protein [Neobacillus cucumis]